MFVTNIWWLPQRWSDKFFRLVKRSWSVIDVYRLYVLNVSYRVECIRSNSDFDHIVQLLYFIHPIEGSGTTNSNFNKYRSSKHVKYCRTQNHRHCCTSTNHFNTILNYLTGFGYNIHWVFNIVFILPNPKRHEQSTSHMQNRWIHCMCTFRFEMQQNELQPLFKSLA